MPIKTNADAVASAWERRAAQLEPIMREATGEATKTLYAESKKDMTQMIYDKPVPTRAEVQAERKAKAAAAGRAYNPRKQMTTKKGTPNKAGNKPAWKRTGNLRRSEQMKIATAYLGIVSNDAKYAKARHNMGLPGSKRKTKRIAPWRGTAINTVRPKIRTIYRDAMKRALMSGVVGFGKLK